jgi:tRNA-2-methylthio-N6-dimethylallyladenosine synthase
VKRLYIRTYGCQMNVYDSARMADVLAPLGYAPADAPDGADMVILNTCHIREKASEKVFSELGRLKALKESKAQAGGRMILAVAGCVAQAEGAEILARAPQVDLVVGPQAYHRLPELVAKAARAGGAAIDTEFPAEPKFDFLPEATTPPGVSAFLSVQEGCDKFCTFCVVPYTRGAEYSRPAAAVLAEARRLATAGAVEITLLGQNVNAYHGEGPDGRDWNLARLIRAMAEIESLQRIRYTTSHPRDLDADLIAAHGEVEALMPFLHLPVQSGSDRILEAMNRRHGRDVFLRLVDRLRAARADLALSSDFIVGFPGEGDADFDDTMRLIDQVGFASAFSFKYSRRPGTPGSAMPGQVPEAVKSARLAALQTLLGRQARDFNISKVGATVPVLFAETGRKPGQIVGKTPWLQSVYAEGNPRLIGHIAEARLVEGHANSLAGEIVARAYEAAA